MILKYDILQSTNFQMSIFEQETVEGEFRIPRKQIPSKNINSLDAKGYTPQAYQFFKSI